MAQVVALSLELKRSEEKLVEFQERGLERARAESTHPAQGRPPPEAHTTGPPNSSGKAQEETNLPTNPGELGSGGAPPEQEESQPESRWTWHKSRAEPKEGRGRASPPLSRRESDRGDESDTGGHDERNRPTSAEGRWKEASTDNMRYATEYDEQKRTRSEGQRSSRYDQEPQPRYHGSPPRSTHRSPSEWDGDDYDGPPQNAHFRSLRSESG